MQHSTLDNAIRAHREGKYDIAEAEYRAVLEDDPVNADALHLLGVLLHQRGESLRAIEFITRAIALRSDVAAYYSNLAEAYRVSHRLDEATIAVQNAIALRPDYAEAHHNHGLILLRRGCIQEALAAFNTATELQPNRAVTLAAKGDAHRTEGQILAAINAYREAIRCDPQFASAHANLGLLLTQLGDYEAGLAHCRLATDLKPQDPVCRANLGLLLLEFGQIDDAMDAITAALELNRDSAVLADAAGRAWAELGDYAQARAWLERALRLDPTLRDQTSCHLAAMYLDAGAPEDALAVLDVVIADSPNCTEAHTLRAQAELDQGNMEAAVASHQRAIELRPEAAPLYAALGQTLASAGKIEQAVEAFQNAIARNPHAIGGYAGLATTLRGKTSDSVIEQLEQLLQRPWLTTARQATIHFALAQVYDGRAEYTRAASHMISANAAQKSHRESRGQGHDPASQRQFAERTIGAYTPEYFARVRDFGHTSRRPVFIVGMPRSGTTLTEQILASHPRVFGAGERRFVSLSFNLLPAATGVRGTPFDCLPLLNASVVQQLAEWHLTQLHELNATCDCVVDKMPENFQQLGWIATLFPNAKIIHCTRDVRDVALSCWITQFGSIRWASDLEHLAERINTYLELMEHYRRALPVPVFEVSYEEMVADQETTTRRLLDFVGLDWHSQCLNFHQTERLVRTASVSQVRQPVYSRSVARWKRYENMLDPLLKRLKLPDGY
jgi:tetratricopeptide (TPR) repeat protein